VGWFKNDDYFNVNLLLNTFDSNGVVSQSTLYLLRYDNIFHL